MENEDAKKRSLNAPTIHGFYITLKTIQLSNIPAYLTMV